MKHLDDTSSMCPECTGNGCKQCMGTGNMPKEAHILWLQDMIKRKNEQIKNLSASLELTTERVILTAKGDPLI